MEHTAGSVYPALLHNMEKVRLMIHKHAHTVKTFLLLAFFSTDGNLDQNPGETAGREGS